MKSHSKLIAAALLLTFSVCSSVMASSETCPQMSLEEYPRTDGSTACIPLFESLAQKVTGCSQIEAEGTLSDLSKTDPSYLKLAEGERDLILAYEPSKETVETLKKYPPLTVNPIGRDALGYSVYYYAANMYRQKDLKLLKISGIEPCNDTIQSAEYPLINEFYCVTGEHSSKEALLIQDWFLTDSGQKYFPY